MEDNENINKDPDARITSSWVFIEKSTVRQESDPNIEYYLKNETSGVQELIEDDLRSNESNCDSDGISVISETEYGSLDCCSCNYLPKINTSDEDEAALNVESMISNKDTLEIECDINNDTETPDFSHTSHESIEVNANNHSNNKLFFTSTVAGVCIVITYLISNYKADAPIYDTNDVTIDNFDEIYDMHLWKNDDFNNTCDYNIDLSEFSTDTRKVNNLVQSYGDIKTDLSLSVIMKQSDTNLPTNTEKKLYQNVNKEKYANIQGKYISHTSNNERRKSKNKITYNQKTETQILKQKENYLKKKDKYLTKKEKYLEKLEKRLINLEAGFRKKFSKMKKDDTNPEFIYFSKKQKKSKSNYSNTTGEWYQKMSFGRSEIRNKEKLSDWIFERSKMRNKLRDKAHWYFNRANGREEIRYSENLRSGKRNNYKSYRY